MPNIKDRLYSELVKLGWRADVKDPNSTSRVLLHPTSNSIVLHINPRGVSVDIPRIGQNAKWVEGEVGRMRRLFGLALDAHKIHKNMSASQFNDTMQTVLESLLGFAEDEKWVRSIENTARLIHDYT
jgi:hypothetical protein